MRLLVAIILAILVPSITTGCAVADDTQPIVAESSPAETPNEVNADKSSATDEPAPPPPAPPKATGALADGEKRFQGAWQLFDYQSDKPLGTLRIDDRDFQAEGVHGEYAGYVSIRADTTPPQIDFTIEACNGCSYRGMTSTGIYDEEDDGALVFAGPVPGDPRPEDFTKTNELWRMRPLDPATEDDG